MKYNTLSLAILVLAAVFSLWALINSTSTGKAQSPLPTWQVVCEVWVDNPPAQSLTCSDLPGNVYLYKIDFVTKESSTLPLSGAADRPCLELNGDSNPDYRWLFKEGQSAASPKEWASADNLAATCMAVAADTHQVYGTIGSVDLRWVQGSSWEGNSHTASIELSGEYYPFTDLYGTHWTPDGVACMATASCNVPQLHSISLRPAPGIGASFGAGTNMVVTALVGGSGPPVIPTPGPTPTGTPTPTETPSAGPTDTPVPSSSVTLPVSESLADCTEWDFTHSGFPNNVFTSGDYISAVDTTRPTFPDTEQSRGMVVFQDVPLSASDNLLSANLTINPLHFVGTVNVFGEDITDAPLCTASIGNITNRPLTGLSAVMSSGQTTIDVKPIIDYLKSQPGWQPGVSNIALIFSPTAQSKLEFESFENPGIQPARLSLTWQSNASP